MANYLTPTKIYTRLDQLGGETFVGNFLGLASAALTAEVTDMIGRHEGIVDGYAGRQYSTPLTGTVGLEMAENWTYKLFLYDMHVRGPGQEVQIKIRLGYEDTMKELRDLGNGKLTIPGESVTAGGTSFAASSNDAHFLWGDSDVAKDTF